MLGAEPAMWTIETPWFDVAVLLGIFAVGNILFGHFEEHQPKWRRVLKMALLAGLVAALSSWGLRWAAYTLIGALSLFSVYIHAWWLPSHGVSGWTGEPKAKYYELIGVTPKGRDH
jgi:hypothetical protein